MEFKPTHITDAQRNQLAAWSKKNKIKIEISKAGHMVTMRRTVVQDSLHEKRLYAQWWPGRDRLTLDGNTKVVDTPASFDEMRRLLDHYWGHR